jgi:hypothetical protein
MERAGRFPFRVSLGSFLISSTRSSVKRNILDRLAGSWEFKIEQALLLLESRGEPEIRIGRGSRRCMNRKP